MAQRSIRERVPAETVAESGGDFDARLKHLLDVVPPVIEAPGTLCGKYKLHEKPTVRETTLPSCVAGFRDADKAYQARVTHRDQSALVLTPTDTTSPDTLLDMELLDYPKPYSIRGDQTQTITVPAADSAFAEAEQLYQFALPAPGCDLTPIVMVPVPPVSTPWD